MSEYQAKLVQTLHQYSYLLGEHHYLYYLVAAWLLFGIKRFKLQDKYFNFYYFLTLYNDLNAKM